MKKYRGVKAQAKIKKSRTAYEKTRARVIRDMEEYADEQEQTPLRWRIEWRCDEWLEPILWVAFFLSPILILVLC